MIMSKLSVTGRFSTVTKCTLLKYIPKYRKLVAYSPDQKLKVMDDVTRGFEVISEISAPSTFLWLVHVGRHTCWWGSDS